MEYKLVIIYIFIIVTYFSVNELRSVCNVINVSSGNARGTEIMGAADTTKGWHKVFRWGALDVVPVSVDVGSTAFILQN